jgi:N4-gp56 family major capsid protein
MANAYTATTDVAGLLPNYYDKVFLERLQAGPIMMQYCMKKPLPANSGKVAYFPRMVVSSTTVSAYKLTEGTLISTEKIDEAQISATVEQFGNAKALWDLTQLTAINSTVEETVKEIADQANNILDKRIIQEAMGTSATRPHQSGFSCLIINTASGAQPATDAVISAWGTYLGTVEYSMTAKTLRYAAKVLRSRNVKPQEDGFYTLVCHSNTAMQLQADTAWQTAYQYTDPENLRKGIAGTYSGVKVQIDNNIVTSAYGSISATIYHSILLGHGALGVTTLDGGVSTYTTGGSADKFDPINQFITFGWKANMVPVRLNASCGAIVMTCDD